jgi:hypothetical protein
MKRAMWAVMAIGAGVTGSVALAQDERVSPGPYGVAIEVSKAVDAADSELSVFRPGVREDGSWGLALISGISSEPDGTVLHQAYLGELGRYFYPASTVKLYAALAAYEQINDLRRIHGAGSGSPDPFTQPAIHEETALRFHPLFEGESVRATDPSRVMSTDPFNTNPITIRHEAHKIFVVSDNPAFNTLYEFVGQDDLNRRLRQWGARETQIVHRLAVARSSEENRLAPRIDVGLLPGAPQIGQRRATMPHAIQPQTEEFLLGRGFLRNGTLVEEPFDFSDKNFTTLSDLQITLARLLFPTIHSFSVTTGDGLQFGPLPGRPLDLTDAQRQQLIASATILPRESESPKYDPEKFPDDHVKFLLPGLLRVRPLEEWRIVNKIGLAYGFVTENAYVEHRPTGRAVFVAAVIHRNPNGIYNDNQYDYETTLAEMATLGEVVGRALVGGASEPVRNSTGSQNP